VRQLVENAKSIARTMNALLMLYSRVEMTPPTAS